MQPTKSGITFEPVSPLDLPGMVDTLSGSERHSIFIDPPGQIDGQIAAALMDLKMARAANNDFDRDRQATNTIINARRALACLVDWYLKRDYFSLCKDSPRSEKDKADLIVRRRLFDEITNSVLYRAIQKRNLIEHQYHKPTVEEAEDIFELVRRTIQYLIVESNPSHGLCLAGEVSHGVGIRNGAIWAEFYQWFVDKPIFVICSFNSPPWLGVVKPDSADHATAYRAHFSDLTIDTLLQILQTVEAKFPRNSSQRSSLWWIPIFKECGLLENATP